MRKQWLITMFCLAFAFGMVCMGVISQALANQVVVEPGWRYTNGYWNFYDPDDRAWYYTNGKNWYTYGDNAWKVYDFNKGFGRKSFYREGYVVPKPGPDIVVPSHRVYVPK